MPPPFSSYAVFMFDRFCFAVSVAALVSFETVSLTPLNTFDATCPTGLFATASLISLNLFVPASFAFVNAPVIVS